MKASAFWFRCFCSSILVMFLTVQAAAKDAPLQFITWPTTGAPVVRFTFGKFKALPGMGTMHAYVMDTMAENLSSRLIKSARYAVYLFDKTNARVGEDVIALSNVGPGETVKFETTVMSSGMPVSVSINDLALPPKTVSLTVNSTPQGAMLNVDGTALGTTPRIITLGVGKHTLIFSKDGFTNGTFPLEIGPDDVSGGTVSFELGGSAFDSIELRDGSVLNGDLVSVSGMDIEVRVGGNIQHLNRNMIKRVLFVQREAPAPSLPPPTTPQP